MGESIKKAMELYQKEMDQHMKNNTFLKQVDLQRFHEEAKDLVIRQLDQASPLSRDQRTGIVKELDTLLPKYAEINYMLANTEDGLPEGEAPAIGIDLGTTYCCVGVFYKGKVHIIKDVGDFTTPSYVMFDSKGNANFIGKRAKENAHKDPENTIYDVKRIIGRKMDSSELQNDMKYWPFTVQEEDGVPKVKVNGKLLYPEQISAKLLGKLKSTAEHFLKLEPGAITKAVITVPAYFNDGQRQATVDAGELAGLEVLTILNEPTAAAISYSLLRLDTKPRKILVFDLGGGTFDVAVLDMKPKQIDVLGVSGDTHLGGEDFDKELVAYCAARFKEEHNHDLLEGMKSTNQNERDNARRRLRRLQTHCEEAKKDLTDGRMTMVSMAAVVNEVDLTVQVTREAYEKMNMKYFEKTIELVDATLKDVGVSKDEIEDIVMVGGSSRIPKVQELLRSYFGGKALNVSIDPDQAVAYGAAVQAALMNGKQALGEFDYQIQDVTAISMGIETAAEDLCVILPKNTKIPIKRKQVFTTLLDNQASVKVKIYQGEDFEVAKNNKLLGKFALHGIPPNEAGEEQVDVWMEMNAMGILHVEAVSRSTNKSKQLTVKENRSRMSKQKKEEIIKDQQQPST